MHLGSNKQHITIFLLFSLLFMILATFTLNTICKYLVENEISKEKEHIRKNLALVRFDFEASVYMDTYLADSLATVVTIDPEFAMNNWAKIAQKLLAKAKYVRSVAFAPNNVITLVYPLKGNEQAIGFDFRTRPEQLKTVLIAKQVQGVYIAGPVNLVQGGIGLIARYPIFSDSPLNTDYWGGVSVVMDYEQLLNDTGLSGFQGAKIALRKQVLPDQSNQVFYGNDTIFDQPDMQYPIRLPSGTWQLAAKFDLNDFPKIQYISNATMIIGWLATLLTYALMVLLYRHYKHTHNAALEDELTQLPNRRFMISLLTKLIAEASNSDPFTLLNIDLNGFKQVNDVLGHEAGDELLRHIANLLVKETTPYGTVARFGGDEFLILLRDISNVSQIEALMTQLRETIEASNLSWGDTQISPSLSIGFAVFEGQITTVKQLLSNADKSMYAHKRRARNQKVSSQS